MQNLVVGHRLGNAGGDGMGQKAFQAHPAHRQPGIHGLFRDRQVQTGAGMLEGNNHQPDQNGENGRGNKPYHGFTADPPNGRRFAQPHNAHRQGTEHQRRNDHLNQAQKHVGKQRNVFRPCGNGRLPGVSVDGRAGEDPQQHEDDDEQREFVCTCHKN